MNRRSFFQRVLCGVAAVVVAPFLPKLPALKPLGLNDPETGIAIRFIKKWDIESAGRPVIPPGFRRPRELDAHS